MKVRAIAAGGALALALAGFGLSPAAANGKGDGLAIGKPADGTKGMAMVKSNPPGQSSGDANRGWRCDDNWGVGKGNPAHTSPCEEESTY